MMASFVASMAGAAIGSLLTFLLDPQRGRARRVMLRDRSASALHHAVLWQRRYRRFLRGRLVGLQYRVTHLLRRPGLADGDWDDATLAQKVESVLFRDPSIPKGKININAQKGVVVLRGELERPEQIRAVEAGVRRVEGVMNVHNLLHLPGTASRAA